MKGKVNLSTYLLTYPLPTLMRNLFNQFAVSQIPSDCDKYTNFYSIQHLYTGTAFIRGYINVDRRNRFGLFNDVKLYVGGGQGKITNGLGEEMTGTYQNVFTTGIAIQPGSTFFITNNIAAEASVSLFGVRYHRVEQITNQVTKGSIDTFDAKFKLNLLSINLGVTFYF